VPLEQQGQQRLLVQEWLVLVLVEAAGR